MSTAQALDEVRLPLIGVSVVAQRLAVRVPLRARGWETTMQFLRPVATAFALLAVHAITSVALAAPSIQECLQPAGQSFFGASVKETFGPSPMARYDHVLVDARGVDWRPLGPVQGPSTHHYAVVFSGTENCWIGGKVVGTGEASTTAPSAVVVGKGYATSDTALYLLDIAKTLHGIRVGKDAMHVNLEDILFSEIKGTCILADHQGDLIIEGAFFKECARVVKWTNPSAGSTLTVRNSLIRINNWPDVRTRGRLFDGNALAANGTVYFENNVVATSEPLDSRSLSFIAANCRDNTLIWLGGGDYPGNLPLCFTLVQRKQAWGEAEDAWMRQFSEQLATLGKAAPPAEKDPPSSPDPVRSACQMPEIPEAIAPSKTVGQGSPASCTDGALRSALSGGGTITFSCGSSPVSIPIGAELVVSSPTVLDGGGRVTLDGQNRTRIIRNNSSLTLKKITLTRGRSDVVWSGSPNGGGAVNTSYGKRLYVVDSTFIDNRTSEQGFGGAIFQAGAGALTVVRSRFENNIGGGGGGIYNLLAGLRVVDSAFVRNRNSSGSHGGGGIMTDGASANSGSGGSGGEIIVCGSAFDRNQAIATGGGAYLYAYGKDTVTVTQSSFSGNSVTPNNGGVSMGGGLRLGLSPALVGESIFRNNSARFGGAIATEGKAQTRVENSTFECNSSDIEGGKVVSEGNTMRRC